jgi:hypothetical protein
MTLLRPHDELHRAGKKRTAHLNLRRSVMGNNSEFEYNGENTEFVGIT